MKRTQKIASALAAIMLAASITSVVASAASSTYLHGDYVWYNSATTLYYQSYTEAINANGQGRVTNESSKLNTGTDNQSIAYSTYFTSTYRWYCSQTKRYYKTYDEAYRDAVYNFGYAANTVSISDKNAGTNILYTTTVSATYPWYCSQTRRYYKSYSDASDDALYNFGYTNPSIYNAYNSSISYSSTVSATYRFYCVQTKRYYKTEADASDDALYNYGYTNPTIYNAYNTGTYADYSNVASSTFPWYSTYTQKYYRTQADAIYASNNNANCVSYAYADTQSTVSQTYPWYSTYTKKYYKTQREALEASFNNASYVTYAYIDTATKASKDYPWYSSTTLKYYKTKADAVSASANDETKVTYAFIEYSMVVTKDYPWYSSHTKQYYKTRDDALKASANVASRVSFALVESKSTVSKDYPWYSSLTRRYYKTEADALLASEDDSSKVSFALTISTGTPYIKDNKGYSTWPDIVTYISTANTNDITVNMNGTTTVDGRVLKTIKGTDKSVSFALGNGYVWTVNGRDVDETDDLDITSKKKKKIPSTLAKTVMTDCTATLRFVAGPDAPLGLEASITVQFNKKRAGLKAYVYHYNTEDETLEEVAKSKINAAGKCTFNADEGGAFIIVLK